MTKTAQALRGIRKDLGFSSARSFFNFLKKKKAVDFNYSYFVRVDGGKALPSQKVISAIAKNLEKLQADELILAYCADTFPEATHLFASRRIFPLEKTKKQLEVTSQHVLTPRQVAILARSEIHYFTFLVLALARTPIPSDEMVAFVQKQMSAKATELAKALHDLTEAQILGNDEDHFFTTSQEFRFPESEGLKNTYLTFDRWDEEFEKFATPNSVYNKTFIRRMSRQYLDLVNNHLNLIFDLIRSAEHVSPMYNDEVVKIEFKVNQGKLPG